MHVMVLKAALHLPNAQSLKAKRSIVKSAVQTMDRWQGVAVAEVGCLDKWQRAELGITVVSGDVDQVEKMADSVERHLWAIGEAEITVITRDWWEDPNG